MPAAGAHGQSFTSRIAMWSARHRKAVALAWLLIVIAGLGACTVVAADTNVKEEAPGESGRAFDLFTERFGEGQDTATEVTVFSHPSLSVDDQTYKETVQSLMTGLRALRAERAERRGGVRVVSSTRVIGGTTTTYGIGLPRGQSPFVAQNETGGDVTFALVDMVGDAETAMKNVGHVVDTVDAAQEAHSEYQISVGGDASTWKESEDLVKEDFQFALFLNLPVTLIILVFAFGAIVAALVPLTLAFAAIITASGILALVSRAYPLAEAYTEIVLLMGLATGIDYALFVVTRFRNERRAGLSGEEALRVATGTSGKAVVFAGVTVLLAISGMLLVDNPIFTSLGLAAIVVVAMAVIISVTLLPALLAMLGDNVNRLRIPIIDRQGQGGGVWGFISDRVLARPAVLAVVTLAGLIALAVPVAGLNLGFNGAKGLSDDVEAKKALRMLEDNFTLGITSPAMVIVDAGKDRNVFAEDVQSQVNRLISLVQADTVSPQRPDAPYGAPIQTDVNDAGDTELVRIPINGDTGEDKSIDAVNRLRDDLVPDAFADGQARALVTGSTAANIDFRDNILFRTPIVFTFVLGLAFLILLLTFRSIVVAVKAIILNLLSVGAAYGLLVLVFQKGWLLEGVLGFEATGIIESWLPLFLFSILFGLSMDYHMFVLGRIKEAYERGASNEEAVSIGIKATAATITNAAAIMVGVATIFAFTRNIGLKQFGFGLAAAIFIDATVIRSILLPASMKLLGDANWYLPRWLKWLPEIKMAE